MKEHGIPVTESLEEGYRHGKIGRTPGAAEQELGSTRSLEETYAEDDPGYLVGKTVHEALTSRPVVLGSGAVVGSEAINLLYDPADIPVLMQYPEVVAGATTVGAGVIGYNLFEGLLRGSGAGEIIDRFSGEEEELLDLEEFYGDELEQLEAQSEAVEEEFESRDFEVEEAEFLDEELERELEELPGELGN